MSAAILRTLLESPALPELVEAANRALAKEQQLRQKFHADITPEHKWEFIQGEVIMHSPALNRHLLASKYLFATMDAYVRVKKLGVVHLEKAMTCFPRNDYEPDITFFGLARSLLLGLDTLKFPVPDLIVEVLSPSTETRDRGIKSQDYALHGGAEYWIIDPVAQSVELHRLAAGADAYAPVERQTEGLLSSEAIAGFEIPVQAIFDESANAQALRQIWSGG